jgi:hypothetical protein
VWTIPDDIDPECIPICQLLNSIPGIETFESCSGHGERPLRVWFSADGFKSLLHAVKRIEASEFFQCRIEVERNERLDSLDFMYEAETFSEGES